MSATRTRAAAPARSAALADLLLVLADSKRLIGMRYAEWILGAPELEAGIACASMAQDEWGHSRLLYALMKDFGHEPDALEHGRNAGEYRSIEALDEAPADWAALVAVNALVDSALSVQMEALRASSHTPARQRVEKMLEEERFHAAHGAAWFRRLAGGGDEAQAALRSAVDAVLPVALRWFGPDSERARELVDAAVTDAAGGALRARYIERVQPLLDVIGVRVSQPAFDGFDESARRVSRSGPDDGTIARVRGDRNREFLMD